MIVTNTNHSTIRKWLIDSQPESEGNQRLQNIMEGFPKGKGKFGRKSTHAYLFGEPNKLIDDIANII